MPELIKAIYDDNLNSLLERLNLLGKFNSGQLKCSFCGEIITFNNLNAFFNDSGNIKLICDQTDCVSEFMSRIQEKEYE
jgi:hypothetical protein